MAQGFLRVTTLKFKLCYQRFLPADMDLALGHVSLEWRLFHIQRPLYLNAGLLLLIWFALYWIIGTPFRLS
jgi:hypothetical protein